MKEKILIAGAGAHCKVVLDLLLSGGAYEVAGLLDDGGVQSVLGVPVLGGDEEIEALFRAGIRRGFVAIGGNAARKRVTARMERTGYEMVSLVSEHAVVSRFAALGAGTLVMPGAVVNAGSRVGRGCILNTNCSVDHDCHLGDFVHIAPGCALSGTVTVGEATFLGTGARVIDGISIGSASMIGAGAAVIRDLPDGCTAVGVPARVIRQGDSI